MSIGGMSIGIICDPVKNVNFIFAALYSHGYRVLISESRADFEKEYGSLGQCSGLIYHPGFRNQSRIEELVRDFPCLPMIIVTAVEEDYPCLDIPVFSYGSRATILQYVQENWGQPEPR